MRRSLLVGLFVLLGLLFFETIEAKDPYPYDNPAAYKATLSGRHCYSRNEYQDIVCEFRVGKSLFFSIERVGQPDALVILNKVDEEGDYRLHFGGLLHECFSVLTGKSGKLSFAFVSRKNAKVFLDWVPCEESSK